MKSKVVNITIPEKLLSEIDQAAKKEDRTRSEFFREATRGYLRNIAFSEPAIEKPPETELRQPETEDPKTAEKSVSPEFTQTPPPSESTAKEKMEEKPKTSEVKPEIYEEPKKLEKEYEERTRPKGFFELLNDVLIGGDDEEY